MDPRDRSRHNTSRAARQGPRRPGRAGAPLASPPRGRTRDVLVLAQAQAVSLAGSQAFVVAAMALLASTGGRAAGLGAMVALSVIAEALAAPLAGGVVDRHPRRDVLVACDVVAAVVVGAFALELTIGPGGALRAAGLALTFGVLGVARAFIVPASRALVAELAPPERLGRANATIAAAAEAAVLAGQALAGLAARLLVLPALFAIDAASYALSALGELALPRVRPVSHRRSRPAPGGWRVRLAEDVRAALRALDARRGLRAFVGLSVAGEIVALPFVVVFPVYVTRRLDAGPEWFGYLLAAFGAGAVAGSALAMRMRWRGGRGAATLAAAWAVLCAGVGALAWTTTTFAAAAALAAAGIGDGVLRAGSLTLVQRAVERPVHGRVFALVQGAMAGASPLALVGVGAIVDAVDDVAVVPGAIGLGLALLGLAGTLTPSLRAFVRDGAS